MTGSDAEENRCFRLQWQDAETHVSLGLFWTRSDLDESYKIVCSIADTISE